MTAQGIKISDLKMMLEKFPDDAVAYAYDGVEGVGIVIADPKTDDELDFLRTEGGWDGDEGDYP